MVRQNGCNQRLATLDDPHRPILSRVRCIAWLCLSFGLILDRPNHKWNLLASLLHHNLVGFSLNLNFSVAALKDVLALLCKLSFFEIAENISQVNRRLAVLGAVYRPNNELRISRRGCDCRSGSDHRLHFLGS
jgi:hypothetical protein